jgi:hypothetical protein
MKRENAVRERRQKTGTTAWKIRIENEDLHLLKRVAEKIAAHDGGMIPKPSITALIQKAVKHYIAEALQRYRGGSNGARPRLVQSEAEQQIQ